MFLWIFLCMFLSSLSTYEEIIFAKFFSAIFKYFVLISIDIESIFFFTGTISFFLFLKIKRRNPLKINKAINIFIVYYGQKYN